MRLFSPRNLSRTAALSGGAEERRESALRTLRLRGEKEAWGAVARMGACCAARHGGLSPAWRRFAGRGHNPCYRATPLLTTRQQPTLPNDRLAESAPTTDTRQQTASPIYQTIELQKAPRQQTTDTRQKSSFLDLDRSVVGCRLSGRGGVFLSLLKRESLVLNHRTSEIYQTIELQKAPRQQTPNNQTAPQSTKQSNCRKRPDNRHQTKKLVSRFRSVGCRSSVVWAWWWFLIAFVSVKAS
jgi:hypothetical protein